MGALDFYNQRYFSRYNLNSDCEIVILDKSLRAVVTDFSFDGLGCIVKDISVPEQLNSKLLKIKADDIDVDNLVKVVRVDKMTAGLKLGI
ncbi:MAG: PilZ domain-containing protein, partial [Nitrospirota bacterium]|nr:PilZ domain-containing protein [Nitrospirota bacterium]